MKHAVILSWHVAPDLRAMPGQERMLAFWAETLAESLLGQGWRVTLLLPLEATPPLPHETPLGRALARQGIGLEFAAGTDRLARACAVDAALAALSPDAVHAPERLGLLGVALSRRAAGLAHQGMAMTLHARGPLMFRLEEEGRFLDEPEALVVDACERQAMRLADAVITANPDIGAWIAAREDAPDVTLTEAALPDIQPIPPGPPRELVIPLPLCGEAGLEFAVAALARAAARQPLGLPVTFLGEPGTVTLGDAAQALLPLSARPGRIAWRVQPAASWTETRAALHRPGVVVLCPARRAAPPELLAFCAAAGLPVLATRSLTAEAAARRFTQTHLLTRAERPAAAVLARLPQLPPIETPPEAPPAPPARAPRPAVPADASLTVFAPATAAMRASLAAQDLPGIIIADAPATEGLAQCRTRFAVLTGAATRLAPEALRALRQMALATGAAGVTAWDSASRPLGGGADIALLRPALLRGHLLLLDLAALRAAGAKAHGGPGMAAELAAQPGGILALHATLAEATAPPPPPCPASLPLPAPLRGAQRLALHIAQAVPPDELDIANRGTTHHFKLLGRRLDALGAEEAARDAWAHYLALDADDGEAQDRHAALCLRLDGRLSDSRALLAFARGHGAHTLPAAAHEALAAARRRGVDGWGLLVALAPLLVTHPLFPQTLAEARRRLPHGTAPREPAMPDAVRAAYARALSGGATS